MSSSKIPESKLGSNVATTVPLLGFGTAAYPLVSSETMKDSLLSAIEVGYRHFDTAALYNSEKCLGEAVAEAVRCGIIKSRDELFITSKLWCSDAHPDRVLPALQNTLRNLGFEYLDLYLIHFPVSIKAGSVSFPFPEEDVLLLDYKHVWEAMEECQISGLTKNIGVSNFSCKKLELILSLAKIPPSVNQVEMNPLWQQKKLREFCKEKKIHVTAYSPLGAKGTLWGTNKVMDSEMLQEIAIAKGKSLPQICLRWAYEQGVSVLVKSFNKERMIENMDIFDWDLSPEELEKINQIPQEKGNPALFFTSDKGPFKSADDFWDENIN
ncbi:non-functional NADPH-dependent codeinone reductase 2-like [Heracleum sosnowskyi]|uniref:Non-functional NADPH-dependent codeinone reductase 2-like n=1 Tax=Heracleum sosnowskyi TaxID=360622 RepID=A0AAD8IJZ7_9APIA|nr:non-functional NADPH-dependent codeinone reductase 2-like [Heracleum sosnowskyi]